MSGSLSHNDDVEESETTVPLNAIRNTEHPYEPTMTSSEEDRHYEKEGKVSRKCCVHPVMLFFLVSLICLGLSVATFYMYYTKDVTQAAASQNICVTCDVLFNDKPVTNLDLKRMQIRARSLHSAKCCCENIEELAAMLEYLLPDQESPRPYNVGEPQSAALVSRPVKTGQPRFGSRIGAHKQLRHESRFYGKREPDFSGPFPLVIKKTNYRWEYSNEVEISEQGIKILHPGLHYIYLSIYFMTLGKCDHYQQQIFTASMYRTKYNSRTGSSRSEEVLKAVKTCCKTCERNSDSSFTARVLELDAGDVIHVNVSAFGVVYITNDVTFMGVSLMGLPKNNSQIVQ